MHRTFDAFRVPETPATVRTLPDGRCAGCWLMDPAYETAGCGSVPAQKAPSALSFFSSLRFRPRNCIGTL
ncbi:hypothetical protein ACFFX0_19365 [Citricoccus parietis]|uniref:Uncharacterized protein n=1 Tax=Citricoccus parietis TaxID=592307 RepID=A0ABV5G2S2_9MICC